MQMMNEVSCTDGIKEQFLYDLV